MQITLYTDGKQVVSPEETPAETAKKVQAAIGNGCKSVPLGSQMFMIYVDGGSGIEVKAIVSELTFSNKSTATESPAQVGKTETVATENKSQTENVTAPQVKASTPARVGTAVNSSRRSRRR